MDDIVELPKVIQKVTSRMVINEDEEEEEEQLTLKKQQKQPPKENDQDKTLRNSKDSNMTGTTLDTNQQAMSNQTLEMKSSKLLDPNVNSSGTLEPQFKKKLSRRPSVKDTDKPSDELDDFVKKNKPEKIKKTSSKHSNQSLMSSRGGGGGKGVSNLIVKSLQERMENINKQIDEIYMKATSNYSKIEN